MTETWQYYPQGEVVSHTGASDTDLTFAGIIGYCNDLVDNLSYVRTRHYKGNLAQWLTVDQLWPSQPSYSYVDCRPISVADPSGLLAESSSGNTYNPCDSCADAIVNQLVSHRHTHHNNSFYSHCMACCVLTVLAGPDCARKKQDLQNTLDFRPRKGIDDRHKKRHDKCEERIGIGGEIRNVQ
jgi:RHS repeat-associated protein